MLSCSPKLEWQLSSSRLHPQNHQRHIGLDHEPKVISLLEWPARIWTLENHTMTDTWHSSSPQQRPLTWQVSRALWTAVFWPSAFFLASSGHPLSEQSQMDSALERKMTKPYKIPNQPTQDSDISQRCPHDRPAPKLLLLVLPAQVYFLCNLALRERLSAKASSTRDPMKSWNVWFDSTLANI